MSNSISEKTIETRIINRNDTLENWDSSTLVLKKGEIALAYIEKKEEVKDANGNVIYDASSGKPLHTLVPTYLIKIGDGTNTFKQLNWLAAPASDVYAWAKQATLQYSDLPETLKDAITLHNNILSGIGQGNTYTTVLDAIAKEIGKLDFSTEVEEGEIPVAISQLDGTISVSYAKLTNANIDDNANISMGKVENLTKIHTDIYGDGTATNPGIKNQVQNIINELGAEGKIMEFIGISSTDPAANEGKGVITINGNVVTDFEAGDTVVYASTGKEFIYYNDAWNEIGFASDIYTSLDTFAKKVLNNGLQSTRLSEETGAATKTLEQEFLDRTLALEHEVGITDDNNPSTTSLKDRTTAIQNTLDNNVPQLNGTNNVLEIAKQVLIFDCGTSEPRDYLGEQSNNN